MIGTKGCTYVAETIKWETRVNVFSRLLQTEPGSRFGQLIAPAGTLSIFLTNEASICFGSPSK
jgi:hypothetical protein